MTVKTFSANTMREAVSKVKRELGDEALILSTKRIPKSGKNPYKGDIFQIEAKPPDKHDALSEKDLINPFTDKAEPTLDSSGWRMLRDELSSIKEMLYTTSSSTFFSDLIQTNPELISVYARLLKAGVSEKRVHTLIAQSFNTNTKCASLSDYTREIFKTLLSVVKIAKPFYLESTSKTGIVAFAGPTGSGKTTTIAKLAAKLFLELKKNTGLISIDNYRIGAFEQLKTYASIIGVPCIPAQNRKDLVSALTKLDRMDYILVDTAGQSHLDHRRLLELKEIINVNANLTNQMVISAATERLDMKDVVDSFNRLNPTSYVFTKVDETKRRGRIIDQVSEHPLPISFITNGQEVPDDLIVADKKTLLQILINPDTNHQP